MNKKKKVSGVFGIILAVLIVIGSAGLLFTAFRNKEESAPIYSGGSSSSTVTKLYTHHFDVMFHESGLLAGEVQFPETMIVINFNCISSNPTPYTKLGDLEGDGYIASAFGTIVLVSHMELVGYVEARIVYEGTILCNVYYPDGSIRYITEYNMENYEVRDSVTKI